MKLLIHDLEVESFQKIFPSLSNDIKIISDDGTIHNCIGCFGCWIKTPATCVIQDNYSDMGEHISKCEELIIISKCYYGSFSPFIKNVLDRSISYMHPDFIIKNGEMHHKMRYKNHINMKVCFYGNDVTEKEKLTAQKLVEANSVNLGCDIHSISFIRSIKEMEGQIF